MKKIYIKLLLLASFAPLFTFAQDSSNFDSSFLESLPEDIRMDLIEKTDQDEADNRTQYKRPSTFIKKSKVSSRFGSKVFSMMQTTLMPINEPNFDGSYILDFGDILELQLIGQKSSSAVLPIKRDGSVNIKDLGKVFLAGLSLDDAIDLIKNKVKSAYLGVEAFITLTNVRDIQIVLAGNVYNPGPYVLNGNSNIFHALMVSGGPSEGGSFRSIDLIRNNKKIKSYDLYDIFIFAKSSLNSRLRSGDLIFINPVQNIVTVSGGVNRPGQYELIGNEKLSTAISFSNGINKFADLNNIKLERILDGSIKSLSITNLVQFNNIEANDGDTVFIRAFPFRTVKVQGAVLNPGSYLMNEGDNIFDALLKAGGYSQNAYPFGAIYENEDVKLVNQMARDILYKDFLDNLLTLSQDISIETDFSPILQLTSELKNATPNGRVIADFVNENQASPLLVKDGDTITIPELINQVYIFGEVSSEGTAEFKKDEGINFYLEKKGGLTPNADKKSIYVLHPNGETAKFSYNRNIFNKQNKKNILYPGSVIFVPRNLDNGLSSRLSAQAYASILGNLGISFASLSVLKD